MTLSTLSDDGLRSFGRSHDSDLMKSLLADEDICGLPASIEDGIVEIA